MLKPEWFLKIYTLSLGAWGEALIQKLVRLLVELNLISEAMVEDSVTFTYLSVWK
ncbi:MAG: hypothetical protein HQL46_16850 [Gammaproteobacteria bacterium]|nr:hypothetical protein [Gammaproteobacteria bacterium]